MFGLVSLSLDHLDQRTLAAKNAVAKIASLERRVGDHVLSRRWMQGGRSLRAASGLPMFCRKPLGAETVSGFIRGWCHRSPNGRSCGNAKPSRVYQRIGTGGISYLPDTTPGWQWRHRNMGIDPAGLRAAAIRCDAPPNGAQYHDLIHSKVVRVLDHVALAVLPNVVAAHPRWPRRSGQLGASAEPRP